MAFTERFEQALVFAARLHRDQMRKGTSIPYITHLLIVAGLVGEQTGDEDVVIAALLHDAIEDQGGDRTRQGIVRQFGRRVADLVDACTDTDVVPKPPWRVRKERYLAHLSDPATPAEALLISAADKFHNCQSTLADFEKLGPASFARFNAPPEALLWYYESVHQIVAHRLGDCSLVQGLGKCVQTLKGIVSGP